MHEPINVMGTDEVCNEPTERSKGYKPDTTDNTDTLSTQTQEDTGRESLGGKDKNGRPIQRARIGAIPRPKTPKKRRVDTEKRGVPTERPSGGVSDILQGKAQSADRYCSLYFGTKFELFRKAEGTNGRDKLLRSFLGFIKNPSFRGKLDDGGLFLLDSGNEASVWFPVWYLAMYATFLPGSTFGVWNASEVMDAYKDNLHEASNSYQVLCIYLGDSNLDDMSKQRIDHFFYSLSAILASRRKSVTAIVSHPGSLYNTKTLERIRNTFTNSSRIG